MVLLILAAVFALSYIAYSHWLAPTRIAIINPLPAQGADIALNNDSKHIEVVCLKTEEVENLSGFDAVMMYSRGLFLNEMQIKELERVASKGTPIYSNAISNFQFSFNRNLTSEQEVMLQTYFQNASRKNYRNALRYIRHIATPHRVGANEFEPPVKLPQNLYYHREYGHYFNTHAELTEYLKRKNIYNDKGKTVAFISGSTFPMEGNRAHVDTLISRLTTSGFNVYPIAGSGVRRAQMISALSPDAIVYLPMGRLGNDSLINTLHQKNIPLFMPFPLIQSREEWLDVNKPVSGGTLTARVVIPEIDGGMSPMVISTQNEDAQGYFLHTPEPERLDNFIGHIEKYMKLQEMPNRDKRVAICYFKSPGKDALLASGMEVIPSLYNFLKRLQREGYNLDGLPSTVEEFGKRIHKDGSVIGSYAKGAQEEFLKHASPVWLSTQQYEQWVGEVLLPEKYKEVVDRYGKAPGNLLATSDSLAVACLQFGNILLFPQPRPALGDDEFKLQHGMQIAPPHSYLAPYLYMQKGFCADALIHFGTHGNLEYTPGKNVGLSRADWADALVGNLPHFYFYTTGNVGEGIIAKRRLHAVLVTHLTPPYAESGMRQRYSQLLEDIHKLLDEGVEQQRALGIRVKREALNLGLSRDLGLDSLPDRLYTVEELERLDSFTEEIANEKMLGTFYTMGEPYSAKDLLQTTLAITADPLAYETARQDFEKGKISKDELQNFSFIAHRYLPFARKRLISLLHSSSDDTTGVAVELQPALNYRSLLRKSTENEFNAMLRGLSGGSVAPAPGGDPVLNPNVLPTGRNMYSINAETTPNQRAWEDGKRLAEITLKRYKEKHGEYPRKVSYTFWAGEFITTEGATLAQVLWMLGVEPVRDGQGRVADLKVVPSEELGRPRINVLVQVSGQLRDIAASRLKMLTDAVRLASEANDDSYPNYVASGTLLQEKLLVDKGASPKRAREMSVMRVFGPVNSGYSTGMLAYTEHSGSWDKEEELVRGYLNNMGAAYGDDDNWGEVQQDLLESALAETDVVIQPRQSNTWGPISLDHVYEFTGALSLAVQTITGKEPDAYMADYRNRNNRRLQEAKEAVAVETRATILNPTFVQERMKGGAGAAQMFGEIFRNIFGWHVMRPSVMDKEVYNDLYRMYVADENKLGVRNYFERVNPAAYQSMTAVLLESARKGYWKPLPEQLRAVADVHAEITRTHGAACTEFVCDNVKLQNFISENLNKETRAAYEQAMKTTLEADAGKGKEVVLKEEKLMQGEQYEKRTLHGLLVAALVLIALAAIVWKVKRK